MSHKKALQQIAAMKVGSPFADYQKLAAMMIAIAAAALAVKNAKGEERKQAQDLEKANAAIGVLERVLANPGEFRIHGAVKDELFRLRKAVAKPETLKKIYRRNERG